MAATRSERGGPDGAPAEPEHLVLAGEFEDPTREAWLDAVDTIVQRSGRIREDALLGAGVGALTRTSAEGIRVAPLYAAEDAADLPDAGVPGAWPFTRGSVAAGRVPDGWDVRQRHAGTDAAACNEAVLADLDGGVTSVWLPGIAAADLPRALEGVRLDLAPVVLDGGAAADAFLELGAGTGDALLGTLGMDPIGRRARTGDGPDVGSVLPAALRAAERHPSVVPVVVDATPVRDAGGSDAQQLGFSLSAGVAYLRALTGDGGLDVAAAARLLEFRYTATTEQFPTIATLRAARRLWARVLEASGTVEVGQRQHAVVGDAQFSRRDPWVNMLRGTVAGFAAGVGGADAVTVPPFDAAIGASVPFSRRIARNTQLLLVEESQLGRVIDPAGGSWYVEHLTDDLARAAWAFFQELEAAGGAVAALDSGLVAERVAAVRAARERDVATRKAPLTGVSEFADIHEDGVQRDPLPGAADDEGSGGPDGGLAPYRPAAAYERYRDRADDVRARRGELPRAFLATLGPLATYTARAGFARTLLAAGGIDAPEAGATDTAADVAGAFASAGTPVAVLCSSDAVYDERAAETAAALRDAGAGLVLLAGRPADEVPGVDGYLYAGCDALAVIDDVYRALDAAGSAQEAHK